MTGHRAATLRDWSARGACALLAFLGVVATLSPARATDRFEKGLLYRISKPGVPASYVFGTIHVADPRAVDLAAPVRKALDSTRVFAPELGTLTAAVGPEIEDAEWLPRGASLAALVGEPTFGELKAQLAAEGVPDASVERLKPWAALLKMSRSGAPAPGVSLDQKLLQMAHARRMHVVPLESIEEQIAAFDSIPMDTQVALLRHVVANRDSLAADGAATVEAWLRRDLAEIARIGERPGARDAAIAPHYRMLWRHIVANRTALLHHRLALSLRAGRVFVAVGASHLAGDAGLLHLLAEDGYTVTRVW